VLLTPADGAEVRHLPVQASELEQALRHTHRLAQGQIEQALDGRLQKYKINISGVEQKLCQILMKIYTIGIFNSSIISWHLLHTNHHISS
jgi:hypothetical protein